MQKAPVQVTVVEYVNEFFKNYTRRAYGKSLLVNAARGAETLMGMLKLVMSRGGRDELRIALHCFKDQLTGAVNSAPVARQQQVDDVFALLSALVDAAERLRQFSPVKEQLSSAVLEEVRYRLYRIVVGDGFSEDTALRRRALDLLFTCMMREAADQERCRARQHKLAAAGAGATGGSKSFSGAASIAEPVGKASSRLRSSFQRKGPSLTGPDVSSWEGLWLSLVTMAPKRMLPLLQSVMLDLYLGKLMPGTPGAASTSSSAASESATAGASSTAVTVKGARMLSNQQPSTKRTQREREPMQLWQATPLVPQASMQEDGLTAAKQQANSQQQQQDTSAAVTASATQGKQVEQQQQRVSGSGSGGDASSSCSADDVAAVCSDDATDTSSPTAVAAGAGGASAARRSSSCGSSKACTTEREDDVATHDCEQQRLPSTTQGSASGGEPAAAATAEAAAAIASQHTQAAPLVSCSSSFTADQQHQHQHQQHEQFGRTSARPAHPVAAGYGGPSGSIGWRPKGKDATTDSKDGPLSPSSTATTDSDSTSSTGFGSGLKRGLPGLWGLQPGSSGFGTGRLIPRSWVQFGAKQGSVASASAATDSGPVLAASAANVPRGTSAAAVAPMRSGGAAASSPGFGSDDPDWGSCSSTRCYSASAVTTPAVHCSTVAPATSAMGM